MSLIFAFLRIAIRFPKVIPLLWRVKGLIKNFPHESWQDVSDDVLFILTQISKLAGPQFAIVAQLIEWLEAALKQHPVDSAPLNDLKTHCEGLCSVTNRRFIP